MLHHPVFATDVVDQYIDFATYRGPAWAIEVARTKGEWITETPTEYILTIHPFA